MDQESDILKGLNNLSKAIHLLNGFPESIYHCGVSPSMDHRYTSLVLMVFLKIAYVWALPQVHLIPGPGI